MGRPKKHTDNAEKQRAYRAKKQREKRNTEALRNDAKHIKIRRPALRYFGGKWRLADWIIKNMPAHEVYVEPYMGAASVFLQKQPAPVETLNDLDDEVINFFDVLRSSADELVRQINLTPYSRAEWQRAYQVPAGSPPVERARSLYIRARQSYDPSDALSHTSPTWRRQTNNNRGKSVTKEWNEADHLYAIAERLKQAQIECRPALEIIQQFDSQDTLFYVDPPYLPTTRKAHDAVYAHEMNRADHTELLDVLNSLQGMVILSGYSNDLYDEMLVDWSTKTKESRTNHQGMATETIWINPPAVARNYPLFN